MTRESLHTEWGGGKSYRLERVTPMVGVYRLPPRRDVLIEKGEILAGGHGTVVFSERGGGSTTFVHWLTQGAAEGAIAVAVPNARRGEWAVLGRAVPFATGDAFERWQTTLPKGVPVILLDGDLVTEADRDQVFGSLRGRLQLEGTPFLIVASRWHNFHTNNDASNVLGVSHIYRLPMLGVDEVRDLVRRKCPEGAPPGLPKSLLSATGGQPTLLQACLAADGGGLDQPSDWLVANAPPVVSNWKGALREMIRKDPALHNRLAAYAAKATVPLSEAPSIDMPLYLGGWLGPVLDSVDPEVLRWGIRSASHRRWAQEVLRDPDVARRA